jgi:membrane-associated protease RseP (regulator of RpoE activity)
MSFPGRIPEGYPAPQAPSRLSPVPVPAPDSQPPSAGPLRWRLNLVLFLLTVLSVFFAGAFMERPVGTVGPWRVYLNGWKFAVPLLSILVVHEFGHYIAARIHKVDASLPYFLPLPGVSPLGTLGAVIAMRGRIRSRDALLDIGASGPLAGLLVAVPVLVIGLTLSPVSPQTAGGYIQEGQSLLYLALKRLVVGPIPDGHDVHLHPTAFAGWAGLLVTMINLLPWGQLDGGHVAYALFGARQNRFARVFRFSLLALFAYNVAVFVGPVLLHRSKMELGLAISNSLSWFVWFLVLGLLGRLSGGTDHPPVEAGALSQGRKIVAWITLALFVLLFMPTPIAQY